VFFLITSWRNLRYQERIVLTTEFICGQAGCATIGVAFVLAILVLVAIGWFYEMWRQWAIKLLEKTEQIYGVSATSRRLTRMRVLTTARTRKPLESGGQQCGTASSKTHG
jgi:hypothetical protein